MTNPTTPPDSPSNQAHHAPMSKTSNTGTLTPPDSPLTRQSSFRAPRKASGLPAPREFDAKDRLQIVKKDIGDGQWSTVSMAVLAGKSYACKRPRGMQASKILYREAQILTVLSEPLDASRYVIPFFGIDSADNTLILEYAPLSLEESVRRTGPVATAPELAQLAKNLVEGLNFLGECNIIHGDIKPGNILITGSEDAMRPVYCDFSASRVDDPECKLNESAGTYDFMAPELFNWRDDTPTFASDIFALGMTLIWAALGYGPYEYADTYSKVSMAKEGEPMKFIRNSSWTSQASNLDLDLLVGGALKKKAQDRWSASEWLQHLS